MSERALSSGPPSHSIPLLSLFPCIAGPTPVLTGRPNSQVLPILSSSPGHQRPGLAGAASLLSSTESGVGGTAGAAAWLGLAHASPQVPGARPLRPTPLPLRSREAGHHCPSLVSRRSGCLWSLLSHQDLWARTLGVVFSTFRALSLGLLPRSSISGANTCAPFFQLVSGREAGSFIFYVWL